jgi:hypothetical protein
MSDIIEQLRMAQKAREEADKYLKECDPILIEFKGLGNRSQKEVLYRYADLLEKFAQHAEADIPMPPEVVIEAYLLNQYIRETLAEWTPSMVIQLLNSAVVLQRQRKEAESQKTAEQRKQEGANLN